MNHFHQWIVTSYYAATIGGFEQAQDEAATFRDQSDELEFETLYDGVERPSEPTQARQDFMLPREL
jgi:hypothetical protein